MNTKGIKFLAVLAVLAMAFAAFAVIADVEGDDAAEAKNVNVVTADVAATVADGKYYIGTDNAGVPWNITAGGTHTISVYLLPGKSVTITGATATNDLTANVYLVTAEPSTAAATTTVQYDDTYSVSVFLPNAGTAKTITISSDAEKKTMATTSAATATIKTAYLVDGTAYTFLKSGESYTYNDAKTIVIPTGAKGTFTITSATNAATPVNKDKVTVKAPEAGMEATATFSIGTAATGDMALSLSAQAQFDLTVVNGAVKLAAGSYAFEAASVINGASDKDLIVAGTTAAGATISKPTASLDGSKNWFIYGDISATVTRANAVNEEINLVKSTGTITVTRTAGDDFSYSLKATSSSDPITAELQTGGADKAITVTAGAYTVLTGDITSEDDEVAGLTVMSGAKITYDAAANIAFTGDVAVYGTLALEDNTSVVKKNVDIYGSLISAAGIVFTVNSGDLSKADAAKMYFKASAGSEMIGITVARGGGENNAEVVIDLSGAMETVNLSGTISANVDYKQTQTVIVVGDLEIKNGAAVTIAGSFQVNEGVTLTITSGSITINNTAATAEINGTVYIDEGGYFYADLAKSVTVSGVISDDGRLKADEEGSLEIDDGGKIVISEEATEQPLVATVDAGGLLDIQGKVGVLTVKNKGEVKLNGAILGDLATINMEADAAKVTIISYVVDAVANTLTIKDLDFVDKTYVTEKTETQFVLTANTVTTGFSNIIFTEKAVKKDTSTGGKEFTKTIQVDGTLTVNDLREDKAVAPLNTLTLSAKAGTIAANAEFADEFIINENAKLIVNNELKVKKIMYLVKGSIQTNDANAKLVVSGIIASPTNDNVVQTAGKVSAAKFTITVGTDKTYYYASLENAVETLADVSEDTTVTILNDGLVVSKNVTIPANIKIGGAAASFTIGSSTDTSVLMYVSEGATIASGVSINVLGSLYAEKAKDLKNSAVIVADVKTTDGTDALYTNLYTALESAEAGDTVEVTKVAGITITKNITIKDGVTLYIPAGIDAIVDESKKVTITVDGVLKTIGHIGLKGAGSWGEEASTTVAVMKVNGTFMTSEAVNVADVYNAYDKSIAGVYYYLSDSDGSFVYIESLAYALFSDAKEFTVYGKVTESNSVIAYNTDGAITITVANDSVLTVTDLSLINARVVTADAVAEPAQAAGLVTGTISGAVGGEIGGDSATVKVTKFSGEIIDKRDATNKPYYLQINAIVGTVNIADGTVTATDINAAASSSFTVAAGAILAIPSGKTVTLDEKTVIAGTIDVYGRLILDKKDIAVSGAINVKDDADAATNGTLTVSKQFKLTGSLVVDEKSAANINGNIIVGTEPTTIGAGAVVSGAVALGADAVILVYPGADVSALVIDADGEGASTAKTTDFVLNGKVYMTAFVKDGTDVTYAVVVAIPDYEIEGYSTADLKTAEGWGLAADDTVGTKAKAEETIDADLIPTKVSIGAGIQMYIDGIRVNNDVAYNLSVGSHTVTANVLPGYVGSIALSVNGKAVQGGAAFSVTSDMKSVVVSATGDISVDPGVAPEPTPEQKDAFGITEILLIVLVILIAVMVIVVLLKMNRS